MRRFKVQSSNVESIGYSPVKGELEVTYNSGVTYTYQNVHAGMWAALCDAESIGGWIWANLRGNPDYPYTRKGTRTNV